MTIEISSDPGSIPEVWIGLNTLRSTYTRNRTNSMLTPCLSRNSRPCSLGQQLRGTVTPSESPFEGCAPTRAWWSHAACLHALCLPCMHACPSREYGAFFSCLGKALHPDIWSSLWRMLVSPCLTSARFYGLIIYTCHAARWPPSLWLIPYLADSLSCFLWSPLPAPYSHVPFLKPWAFRNHCCIPRPGTKWSFTE